MSSMMAWSFSSGAALRQKASPWSECSSKVLAFPKTSLRWRLRRRSSIDEGACFTPKP